jgi:SOS-response transcriptional repressor LexA
MNRKYDYDKVLEYIIEYKKTHDGNSPSIRKLVKVFETNSTRTISYILESLERRGLVSRVEGKIHVTGGQWTL